MAFCALNLAARRDRRAATSPTSDVQVAAVAVAEVGGNRELDLSAEADHSMPITVIIEKTKHHTKNCIPGRRRGYPQHIQQSQSENVYWFPSDLMRHGIPQRSSVARTLRYNPPVVTVPPSSCISFEINL